MKRIPSRTIVKKRQHHFSNYNTICCHGNQWSDLAEFRTHPSFYACPHCLQVWKGWDEKLQRKCDDIIFSILSLWDFFHTLKGSQLRGPWSDLAEFRTHSSSYVYHRYLQVWNESDQKRSRKRDDVVFPTVTLSVAMETSGSIWLNFGLIQALMHVLITWKYEKDPIKNSGENVMTSFSPL